MLLVVRLRLQIYKKRAKKKSMFAENTEKMPKFAAIRH
jgi:hypothetical protein